MKRVNIKENSWVAKIAARKLNSKNVAMVLGKTIHLHGVAKEDFLNDDYWLRHELKHVEQYAQHGFIGFLVKYLWNSAINGYHNCKFEKEAREAEKDEYMLARYDLPRKNYNV